MIIAISGKKGSGKDTAGKIIQSLYYLSDKNAGYRIEDLTVQDILEDTTLDLNLSGLENVKFADKLKEIVCLLIGCHREQLESQEFKETPLGPEWEIERVSAGFDHNIRFTPRLLLQQIGTDLFRNQLHPDIWVNSLFSKYTKTHYFRDSATYSPETRAIELDYPKWVITDLRFKNEKKRIEEMGGITIRISRFEEEIENEHPSETELDNEFFRYTIVNEGTIDELIKKIEDILIQEGII